MEEDRLNTVTESEGVGLANFEKMIERLFDNAETKLTKLHQEINDEIDKVKIDFVSDTIKDICNMLTTNYYHD